MVMQSPDWTQFDIDAAADAGILPRLLELFAQRGDIPAVVQAARLSDTSQRIEICADGLDAARARVIAAKMQAMVGVWTVRLETGKQVQRAAA
jgi:acetolactate synthase small subunit